MRTGTSAWRLEAQPPWTHGAPMRSNGSAVEPLTQITQEWKLCTAMLDSTVHLPHVPRNKSCQLGEQSAKQEPVFADAEVPHERAAAEGFW